MAHPLNLLSTLDASRSADQIIAWRGGVAVSWGEFHARVADWSALLGESPGDAFALLHRDAIEFAAALFGAWLARKTVFLPGDNLPGTCAGLRANVAGFLGEFDAEWQPKAAPLGTVGITKPFASLPSAQILPLSCSTLRAAPARPSRSPKISARWRRRWRTLENNLARCSAPRISFPPCRINIFTACCLMFCGPSPPVGAIQASSFSCFEDLSATLAAREAVLVSSPAHLEPHPGNSRLGQGGGSVARGVLVGRAVSARRRPGVPTFARPRPHRSLWQLGNRRHCLAPAGEPRAPSVERAAGGDVAPRCRRNREEVLAVRSKHLPSADWFRTADRAQTAATAGLFSAAGSIESPRSRANGFR